MHWCASCDSFGALVNDDGRRHSMTLTTAGRAWALAHAPDSIVARIALFGSGGGWPKSHVRTAIEACNRKAATA